MRQTIGHAQTRRFVDAKLIERLLLRSVALCREHGLIDGTQLSVDGFDVEADAALAGLRASLAPVDDGDGAPGTPGACAEAPTRENADGDGPALPRGSPRLELDEPRSGPTPTRRGCNARSTSQTDPDLSLN